MYPKQPLFPLLTNILSEQGKERDCNEILKSFSLKSFALHLSVLRIGDYRKTKLLALWELDFPSLFKEF